MWLDMFLRHSNRANAMRSGLPWKAGTSIWIEIGTAPQIVRRILKRQRGKELTLGQKCVSLQIPTRQDLSKSQRRLLPFGPRAFYPSSLRNLRKQAPLYPAPT